MNLRADEVPVLEPTSITQDLKSASMAIQRRGQRQTVRIEIESRRPAAPLAIPDFDPKEDDMSLFLNLFQRQMKFLKVAKENWVAYLLGVLHNEVMQFIIREPDDRSQDFDHMKDMEEECVADSYWISELSVRLSDTTNPPPIGHRRKEKVKKVQKIAEGSYGEIYTVATYSDSSDRVLKTVGVYGSPRDEPRLSLEFDTAVSDAVCSKHLSKLTDLGVFQAPNFPKVYSIDLVKGKAPKCLVEAWKDFNDSSCREKTCHFRPDFLESLAGFVTRTADCECPGGGRVRLAVRTQGLASRQLVVPPHHANPSLLFYRTVAVDVAHLQRTSIPHRLHHVEDMRKQVADSFYGNVFAMDLSYLSDTGEDQNDPIFLNYNNIYRMMKDELRDDFSSYKPVTNIWWLSHIILKVQASLLEHASASSGVDRIALYALDRLRGNILRYSSTMDFLKAEIFGESETQETMETPLSQQ
ncbi:putative serine/threonine-protein kinase like protein [Argiope bruennichi]|uniref:non-specific serine/threonine protein kinase n=1 Tax=Argiope bruennichi TaxID=94029 RepID=A0A8T0EDT7_ARGBR|nr:putative serine/threonine-protein kinase like protein [Argiope bruennichi]